MDYVGVLKDLISIDTSVPPGLNYERTVDYLEPIFREVGLETQKIYIPKEYVEGREGRVDLITHRKNSGKPRLIFYTHMDVVPAEGWDAFTPKAENGKIYGRGAADMKGAIVALLLGLGFVKEKSLKYDISVMVTTDEEVSQADQMRYLRKFLEPVSEAYFFSLDCGFGYVTIANLGAIFLHLKIKGKSVHSAASHLGENAVEKAILLVNALLDLKKEVLRKKSEINVPSETGLKKMEPRLNVNVIQGGFKVNVVPDECKISIDRRLIPEEDLKEVEEELMRSLSSVKEVNWEIERISRHPSFSSSSDPIVDELAAIIERVTGRTGKFGMMGSGDFLSVASNEWGAKCFGLGVFRSESNIHGKDEFVYQKDIEDLALITSQLILA